MYAAYIADIAGAVMSPSKLVLLLPDTGGGGRGALNTHSDFE